MNIIYLIVGILVLILGYVYFTYDPFKVPTKKKPIKIKEVDPEKEIAIDILKTEIEKLERRIRITRSERARMINLNRVLNYIEKL